VAGTLQIGEAAVLAERTGIPVVSNLRSRDMAAGGEGAPLAPYIDALLFGSPEMGRVVQNIGGIGNATVLPAGCGPAGAGSGAVAGVFAFDTGPGNMVIDGVVRLGTHGERDYDEWGRLAASGRASEEMVGHAMRDPYFARKPPKSTGREVYGSSYASAFYEDGRARGLCFEDIVATATAFTAESIARSYRDFVLPLAAVREVLVCGGGALNPSLRRMIAERLSPGIAVLTTAERGVPDQAREAMAFAALGHESLMGRPGNLPAVTGARRAVVLGDLTL
jgi:anhydro-N-acetylmuramic acid kinase